MLHMRSLPDEHHNPKACNDADSCPTLRTGVRGIYLAAPLDAEAGTEVQTGLLPGELVASFPAWKRCSPAPWGRPRTGGDSATVRKIRGTLWQQVRRNVHDHCQFCSYAPEVYWLSMHAFSPHISRG